MTIDDDSIVLVRALDVTARLTDQVMALSEHAAGGVLLGEGLHYANSKQNDKSYQDGYDKGRSDAVKQQYWLYVSMQQAKAGNEGRVRLYEVHLPEQVIDGVIFKPTTQFLRIEGGGASTQ